MHKKMVMCKKDDRQKSSFFVSSKVVDLSSDIWPSRNLKGSLQNIKLMLDLLRHKRISLIITVVDGSSSKQIFQTVLERKMLQKDITFTWVLQ